MSFSFKYSSGEAIVYIISKLTLILSFFVWFTASAQPCLPDGIHLTNQNAIDNFSTNYPDCTEIEGLLRISGASVNNFQGLQQITSLKNGLLIESTSAKNLEGFENLQTVDSASLTIRSNALLEDISALGNSNGNWRLVELRNMPLLKSLDGIEKIRRLSNQFYLENLESLEDYTAVQDLEEVQGNFILLNIPIPTLQVFAKLSKVGGLSVFNCKELLDLKGLEKITSVENNVQFNQNAALRSLAGLENLSNVGQNFQLINNDELEDLTAIQGLQSIGRDFLLIGNARITELTSFQNLKSCWTVNMQFTALNNLQGLEQLTSLNSLLIQNNDFLKDLRGLENLELVENFVAIRINPQLENLAALSKLRRVGRGLEVFENNAMEELGSLSALDSIGSLFIENNEKLVDLSGLESLQYIEDGIGVTDNPQLKNLSGLLNLSYLGSGLTIFNNSVLEEVGTLNSLESVGSIIIARNDVLNNLEGFSALKTINGVLSISRSPAIRSFSGLEGVNTLRGTLSIFQNDNLETLAGLENMDLSEVLQVTLLQNPKLTFCKTENICRFIADTPEQANVSDNAEGCKDPEEIAAACLASSITDIGLSDYIRVFPQPVTHTLQIEIAAEEVQIPASLFSLTGQHIFSQVLTEGLSSMDISSLPSGTYFLQLGIGNDVFTHKVMKF